MDIGLSFAIFIIVAIILLLLFCLLLKLYAFKISHLNDQEQNQSMIQIDKSDIIMYQGAYSQFKSTQTKTNLPSITMKQEDYLIEYKSNLIAQFNISNDIYGLSSFRKRLNIETTFSDSFTHKKAHRITTSRLQKLQKNITNLEQKQFVYVKKIIQYSQKGLQMIENEQQKIWKLQQDTYKLIKITKQNFIEHKGTHFDTLLQLNGFQVGLYCCYKYINRVSVGEMRLGDTKLVKQHDLNCNKQMISLDQFEKEKESLYTA